MRTLSLHYPDDLLITSGKSPQALEAELIRGKGKEKTLNPFPLTFSQTKF